MEKRQKTYPVLKNILLITISSELGIRYPKLYAILSDKNYRSALCNMIFSM